MEVELINADVPGGRIVLSGLPALIGRSRTTDVCLNDPSVAEFQCMIVQDVDESALRSSGVLSPSIEKCRPRSSRRTVRQADPEGIR